MSKPVRRAKKNAPTLVVEAYCPHCERSFAEVLDVCPEDGARLIRLTQQDANLVGTTFDSRLEIVGLLGDGGMGAVYRARDLSKGGREVTMKVIRGELTNDIGVAKRFLREAKVSARFDHRNTVKVYDYGQTADGVLFLTMELLAGQTLEQVLLASGPLDPLRLGLIAAQIFDALSCAHEQDVIHRDLKPSNIMLVERDGREVVKVLDFGLAKSLGSDFNTTAGFLMGTPAYLAPEIILRGQISFSSDLYAVGVLMYEVLTGAVPFTDDDIPAVLMAHAHRRPPPLPAAIPAGVASFVMRLLSKRPADRFSSALAARDALLVALEDLTDVESLRAITDDGRGGELGATAPMGRIDLDDEDSGSTIRSGRVEMSFSETAPLSAVDQAAALTGGREAIGKNRPKAPAQRFVPSSTKLVTPLPGTVNKLARQEVADTEPYDKSENRGDITAAQFRVRPSELGNATPQTVDDRQAAFQHDTGRARAAHDSDKTPSGGPPQVVSLRDTDKMSPQRDRDTDELTPPPHEPDEVTSETQAPDLRDTLPTAPVTGPVGRNLAVSSPVEADDEQRTKMFSSARVAAPPMITAASVLSRPSQSRMRRTGHGQVVRLEVPTAMVSRSVVRRGRKRTDLATSGVKRLLWAVFGAVGVLLGVLAWWLLGL